jgi:hypothetical protein
VVHTVTSREYKLGGTRGFLRNYEYTRSLPCSQKPNTGSYSDPMNPFHILTPYLSIYGYTVLCWALAVFFFSFLPFYTVSRTPCTGDQPVARPLPTHRTAQHRINAHRHPCLEWDSKPRSQCSNGRRRFMP